VNKLQRAVLIVCILLSAIPLLCFIYLHEWKASLIVAGLYVMVPFSVALLRRLFEWIAPIAGRTIRGHWRALGICIVMLVFLWVVIPQPIEGYWRQRIVTEEHLCNDHAFLEFTDGRVVFHHGEDAPRSYGTYKKIGWNRYEWCVSDSVANPFIVDAGWFFSRWHGVIGKGEDAWAYRDYQFWDARKISQLARPQNPVIRSTQPISTNAASTCR
jgi:hypothetical protein